MQRAVCSENTHIHTRDWRFFNVKPNANSRLTAHQDKWGVGMGKRRRRASDNNDKDLFDGL